MRKYFFVLIVLFTAGFCQSVFAMPLVTRTVLKNGLVLIVSKEHSLPFITMELLIKAGSKDDPQGEEGLAGLTASSLTSGTVSRTEKQIGEELDFYGAALSAQSNKDYTTVGLRVLTKDVRSIFPIFMDVVLTPSFPAQEIKKNRSQVLAAIQSQEDQPGVVAEKAFETALYSGGPYGHPVEGTRNSVEKLERDMMEMFHKSYYHPNNAIIVVVGDADDALVKDYLIPELEKWPQKPIAATQHTDSFNSKKEMITIHRPVTQSNIIMGHRGVSRDNPDYYAILIMNYILGGGGLTSRLAEDIRNSRGLAYAVDSFFDAKKYPGSFQIVLETKNASAREAIEAAVSDMVKMRTKGVTDKELQETKKFFVGNFPQKLSTQARTASFFGQVEYYGLGLDYRERYPSLINAVSSQDVLRAARTYIVPDTLLTVVVADLQQAGLK
jgi:zinc protease